MAERTAYVDALQMLGRRELSEKQLRDRLLEREHSPEDVERAIQLLLENRAELGGVILPVQHPNLLTQAIGQARLVCICPYNHPLAHRSLLSIADLLPYPLISYGGDTPFGTLVEQMYQEAGHTRRVAVEVSSPQNACSLVQAGAGIAIVDEFSVKSRTQGDFVVRPINQAKILASGPRNPFSIAPPKRITSPWITPTMSRLILGKSNES